MWRAAVLERDGNCPETFTLSTFRRQIITSLSSNILPVTLLCVALLQLVRDRPVLSDATSPKRTPPVPGTATILSDRTTPTALRSSCVMSWFACRGPWGLNVIELDPVASTTGLVPREYTRAPSTSFSFRHVLACCIFQQQYLMHHCIR